VVRHHGSRAAGGAQVTATYWRKDHAELAAAGRTGFYSAEVRAHHWPGCVVFRAYPQSGDHCTEFIGQDDKHVTELAERWLAGEMPEGFYSAAY
jgi:hypothetical protein